MGRGVFRDRVGLSRHARLGPHRSALHAEAGDIDVEAGRARRDMDGHLLTRQDAQLSGVAFDKKGPGLIGHGRKGRKGRHNGSDYYGGREAEYAAGGGVIHKSVVPGDFNRAWHAGGTVPSQHSAAKGEWNIVVVSRSTELTSCCRKQLTRMGRGNQDVELPPVQGTLLLRSRCLHGY